jgi:hypothetical protein
LDVGMKFTAPLELHGKTATGITVPDDVVASLNAGKRVPVTVTINGYSYASTVAPYNGKYLIPVSADVRAAAKVEAGDTLTVTLTVDSSTRSVDVPADLAAALKKNARAKTFFGTLSFSQQRAYTDWIEQAKKPETRAARVEKTIEFLNDGKKARA